MKPVAPGFKVQLAPPPESVAVPVPPMPGTGPDPDSAAMTAKPRVACGAARSLPLPGWSALMVQVPAVRNVSAPVGVMVHTLRVDDVKVGTSPESEAAVCVALGVMELEDAEAGPVPATLSAVTVKVYAWPLVSPVTTIGELAPATGATSGGLTVTVYPVMDEPPMSVGAVNATDAWVSPAMAVPMVGAPGTMALTVKDRLTCVAGR